jgi:hypothetical protein
MPIETEPMGFFDFREAGVFHQAFFTRLRSATPGRHSMLFPFCLLPIWVCFDWLPNPPTKQFTGT